MNMDCHEARHIFASGAASAAAAGRRPRVAAAEAHIAACAACQTRLDQLSMAVLSMADDELSCAECGARLHAYVEADLAGADAAAVLPWVHAHLATCPECRGDFAEARLALADLALGRLAQPEHTPDFDVSFLRPTARPAARDPRWLGRVAAAILLLLAAGGLSVGVARIAWPGAEPWLGLPPGSGSPSRSGADQGAVAPGGPVRPGQAGPAVPEGRPPESPTAHGRLAGVPIARQRVPVLTTPVATDTAVVLALAAGEDATARPGRVSPGPTSPGIAPPATASARAAVAPAPTALPTVAPPAQATDEPDDEPTPTASPTATPTPNMITRCELRQDWLDGGELTSRCDVFPRLSQFDLYTFQVENHSRWAFSLCNRSVLDTIIAIYAAGAFDPANACQGIMAHNDDYCGAQSRLTVDLDPGTYWLVIAEKYGDVNGPYAFKTEAEEGAVGSQCPVEIFAATATPTLAPTDTPTVAPADAPTIVPLDPPAATETATQMAPTDPE